MDFSRYQYNVRVEVIPEVLKLDFESKTWTNVNYDQVYALAKSTQPVLLYFKNVSHDEVSLIRQMFKLDAVIDYECSTSVLNVKDQVLGFTDYVLLTISDLNIKNDLEKPIYFQIIYSERFLLVFSIDDLYTLNELSKEMDVKNFKVNPRNYKNPRLEISLKRTPEDKKSKFKGLESAFCNMLYAMYDRFEKIIQKIEENSVTTYDVIDGKDKDGFLYNHNFVKQKIIHLRGYLTYKIKVMKKMRKMECLGEKLKVFLQVFENKSRHLTEIIDQLELKIDRIERIHTFMIKDAQTTYTGKIDRVVHVFESIATITLPLFFLATFYGMNVTMPMGSIGNLWPFSGLLGACFIMLVFFFVYFVLIGWIIT